MTADFEASKRSRESVDYAVDYANRLPAGVTISSSSWRCTSSLISMSLSQNTSQEAKVRISGGVPGESYFVISQVKLTDGQVLESVIELTILEE